MIKFSMRLNIRSLMICVYLTLLASVQSVMAESWDFRDNSAGFVVAKEEKSSDQSFDGTKLILDTQFAFKSEAGDIANELACCKKPNRPEYFYGLVDAHLRYGTDRSKLEYVRFEITPFATMWQPDQVSQDKLRTKWDLTELGTLRYVTDEVLQVDSYIELSFLRAGRVGAYQWSNTSPFTLTAGLQASAGWAWAESENTTYTHVSNPFVGVFYELAIEHSSWGRVYARSRFVNGVSFSSPARGHPTAREARARFGYYKKSVSCLSLDIYIEKRSFNFDEGSLPALYTKSGTAAVDLTCHW